MNKEHYWPEWLIEYANIGNSKVYWLGKNIKPGAATIPLCIECNSAFGTQLEGPMKSIFDDLDSGKGLSDKEAELTIRWLWKFEGISWSINHISHPTLRYSEKWTLIDRVLGKSFGDYRDDFCLAVGVAKKNDEGFSEWPVGLDSGIAIQNSVFVSGVFYKFAIMSLDAQFKHLVPKEFQLIQLKKTPTMEKEYFPDAQFDTIRNAVKITQAASIKLCLSHELISSISDTSNQRTKLLGFEPKRIELP
ncbi:MAG: hypothetical protein CMN56_00495 [Sneathiella sp.]|uniref:hypothetical protein n=1 Tax=Sneathiella sp. TaxID=1964365 RepID=UPI000C4EA69D|nr:hypothetical protein [Sneathiella sp.]MAZ01597.1 hypothetical protein [Sneathiella sp.]|tara:strand:+ start:756 stop:1499 length:744 start_codon:yes stop_codon:yes gene_type:complete